MFIIPSNFIGIFKIGDNICYNFRILKFLYNSRNKSDLEDMKFAIKPIIITFGSIMEALFYDLYFRINNQKIEGVSGLSDQELKEIRNEKNKQDKLSLYIAIAKKHNIFHTNPSFYDLMEKLNQLRNMVHIQKIDFKTKFPIKFDEEKYFNDAVLEDSEKILEKFMKILCTNHPRDNGKHFVNDFELPWEEHLKNN